MKLTVLERLVVLQLLPAEGDVILLRTRQGMISKIGLAEEEIERYEFKHDPETNTATWRTDIPQEEEILLSDVEKGIVKSALVKLNKDRKLTPNHLSLYEKFVDAGEGA